MDPEEGQVDHERPHDQADHAIEEVLVDVLLHSAHASPRTHHAVATLDVQNAPEIPDHGRADRHEGEQSDHLASQRARERGASSEKPKPPLLSEFPVALLMEFDVAEQRHGHKED